MTRASSAAGIGWCRLGGGGPGSPGMGWRVGAGLARSL